MNGVTRVILLTALCTLLSAASGAIAQDWPQWRGPNRDAKAVGFNAPASWPATLTKKWDVTVGDGVANPSLVGDRLYVIAREGGEEIVRCLNAMTGEEIWKKSYESEPATGAAGGFPGPRSTPTVVDGKVLTISVQGLLMCYDASNGAELWKKDEFAGSVPRFFTSSSPIVVDGMCIAQLGGRSGGAMIAYDLASGQEKWRVSEGSAAYGSPALMTVDGMKVVIAPSETNLVAVNVADGKVVWQILYEQGRYNSSTPMVDGQTLIVAGPGNGVGLTAWKLSKEGEGLKEEQVWQYSDNPVIYNTPVIKDGDFFGLSTRDELFCVKVENGQATTGWATPIAAAEGVGQLIPNSQSVFAQRQGRGQRGGRGGRGGGRGGGGYGSVVDGGSVLFGLNSAADLVVFRPSDAEFTEVARYKVSEEGGTYSHPIPSNNGIYIKDRDSVALWTIE